MTEGRLSDEMERRQHWLQLAREMGAEDDYRALLDGVRWEAIADERLRRGVCPSCQGTNFTSPAVLCGDTWHDEVGQN